MVTKGLEKRDRILLAVAAAIAVFMSYFLYDDSLLFDRFSSDEEMALGSISSFKNDVRKKSVSRFVWQPVRGETVVSFGDRVFTGPSSFAEVHLTDGSVVTLAPNSLIVFEKKEGQVALNLKFGQVQGNLAENIVLKVNDKKVQSKGSVKVASSEPVKSRKPAAEEILWVNGPPPLFLHAGVGTPIRLSWKSKVFMGRYRVQASTTSTFEKIALEETTLEQRITLRNYPATGQFFFRVLAEDLTGEIAGATPSVKSRLEEVEVPRIIEPSQRLSLNFKTDPDGDPVEKPQTKVAWDFSKPAEFIYQMAADENFERILSESRRREDSAFTPPLKPGNYFFRVRVAGSRQGVLFPWSETTKISVTYAEPLRLEAPVLYTNRIFHNQENPTAPYITWKNIEGANKYEFELASDPDFKQTRSVFSPDSQLTFKNWIPGQHYFRVFALSKKGLKSPASEIGQIRVLAARPELMPVQDKIVMGRNPEDPGDPTEMALQWKASDQTKNFLIEVAAEPSFSQPIRVQSRNPSSVVTLPKPGKYFWRVRGQNERGQPISNYSEIGSLTYQLKVPLSTPEPFEPKNETTLFFQRFQPPYLWVQWSPVRQAASYVLEISKNPTFDSIALKKQIEATRYLITEQLPEGPLFWRIRAESDSGRVSNWSEVRRFSVLSGRRVLLSE